MNKLKLTVSCASVIILAFGCLIGAVAQTAPYTFENGTEAASRGVIEVGDAKFDSRDLGDIYTEVSNGKNSIETAITNAGLLLPSKAGDTYTFAELAEGVNPWDDIQAGIGYYSKDSEGNYVRGDAQRSAYTSIDSIEDLDKAIADDNYSYGDEKYTEGYTAGLAQAAADASSNIPSGYNFNISISLPLNGKTSSTWIQNDEETTQTASASTTIDVSSGVFKSIKISPSFTTQSGGPHHSESTNVTVTAVKNGGTFTLSNKGNYTYDITDCTSVTVNLYASVYSDAWGTDQHNTITASVSGTATLSS